SRVDAYLRIGRSLLFDDGSTRFDTHALTEIVEKSDDSSRKRRDVRTASGKCTVEQHDERERREDAHTNRHEAHEVERLLRKRGCVNEQQGEIHEVGSEQGDA